MQTTRHDTLTVDEIKTGDRLVDLPNTIVRGNLATDGTRKRLVLSQRGRKGRFAIVVPRWIALDVDRPV